MARKQREQSGVLRRRKPSSSSSSSPGPAPTTPTPHFAPVVVLHQHHHYAGSPPMPLHAAAQYTAAAAADTRTHSGGESDETASTCTTDLSLGSSAAPCFYQSGTYNGTRLPRRRRWLHAVLCLTAWRWRAHMSYPD